MKIKYYTFQKIAIWLPLFSYVVFVLWVCSQIEARRYFSFKKRLLIGFITLLTVGISSNIVSRLFYWVVESPLKWHYYIFSYFYGMILGSICLCSQKIMVKLYDSQRRGDTCE